MIRAGAGSSGLAQKVLGAEGRMIWARAGSSGKMQKVWAG